MKHKQLAEPVAVRYDFDGYGYIYMDAGSGSDWASRVKNCEFLYTHPMRELIDNSEQLPIAYCEDLDSFGMNVASQLLGLNSTDKEFLETPLYAHPQKELTDEEIGLITTDPRFSHIESPLLLDFARAIVKASRGEK